MHEGRVIAEGAPETLTEGATRTLESVFVRHLAPARREASPPSLGVLVSARAELRPDEVTGRAEAVDVHDLTCRFGTFTAVDDVTLHIEPGEILGLLGPNGAGKTTLIKTLCGLQSPTSGSAVVGGLDVVGARRALRARVGYMSQRFSLYRDQTVLENLELSAGLYGLRRAERRARIATLLATLELEALADRLPLALPLGIRQRLALACAIIHDPHVLFLDEPTAGVDPLARRHFWDIVHFLAREASVTVLVSTHYMDEAVHCDRLGLMHQGRLVALGAPDELRRSAEATGGRMVTVDVADFARAFVLLRPRFPEAMLYGRRIRWQSREPERDRAEVDELLAGARLETAVEIGSLSIEDTFVSVLRSAGLGRG
jgi:ABC-2 type transport system ATP-binding protein